MQHKDIGDGCVLSFFRVGGWARRCGFEFTPATGPGEEEMWPHWRSLLLPGSMTPSTVGDSMAPQDAY